METTYNEFIEEILRIRGRFNCGDEYHERHHIVPKCMGGTNDEDNLIDLFAREHYLAHKMLAEENPHNKKLNYAWWAMSAFAHDKRIHDVTPAEYEQARLACVCGENNYFYGRDISGEKNPMYGVHRYGKDSPHYGKKHSEESKRKMSEYRVIPVEQYTLDGVYIKTWPSPKAAADYYGLTATTIKDARRGRIRKAAGFQWKYPPEYREEKEEMIKANNAKHLIDPVNYKLPLRGKDNPNARAVNQYDLDGNFVRTWGTITEASKAVGAEMGNIVTSCKSYKKQGKKKRCKGYYWHYACDDELKETTE